MGDGGVACMPLQQQQQQRVIEKLPSAAEETICGGKSENGVSSELVKVPEKKKVIKVKKVKKIVKKVKKKIVPVKKKENVNVKKELALDIVSSNGVESGEICGQKEEVEEGELGTLKWPRNELENGEFVPEKLLPLSSSPPPPPRSNEIENGDIATERWKKMQVEKGEVDIWRKKEIISEKGWKGENEKGAYGSWRGGISSDVEKGEFIPDRWHKGDTGQDDYGYSRINRYESCRDKGWKTERDWECTPSSGRYAGNDFYRKKEFNRSGSQHVKSAPRWEGGQERNIRISSKIADEEKNEYNGRIHAREYSSGSRLKRHGNDSDGWERKQYGDYAGFKSRRLCDDGSHHVYSDHHVYSENHSRHSVERSYRNSSSKLSADKYSSRHHESSLPTRLAYDKHGCSPRHSERSPHDRARYYDNKDHTSARRSPYGRDRSPYDRDRSPYGRDRSPYSRERSPYSRDRSPYSRERSPYNREKSLHGRERSPYSRERSPYNREKSLHGRERSPCDRNWDRSRNRDLKLRSPIHAERSPQNRGRHHGYRDRTPNLIEQFPFDRTRQNNDRETSNKTLSTEKHNSQHSCKNPENKNIQKEPTLSGKELIGERSVHDANGPVVKGVCNEPEKEQESCRPAINCQDSPCLLLPTEEQPSMEEDMDICDTPPHVPVFADSSSGKWFYLDYCGLEHGPSKLSDIKVLVDEGVLMSDHFIKHIDSDRWLTVENAASPLVAQSFPLIVSDSITQLVNPPEASGNLLSDTGDILQSGPKNDQERQAPFLKSMLYPDDNMLAPEPLDDLHFDERVGVLLEGYDVIPGRELEAITEALQMNFEYAEWDDLGAYKGFPEPDTCLSMDHDSKVDFASNEQDFDKDNGFTLGVPDDWFSAQWSCKGGDWKRNEESQDRYSKKKLVLNDGFPLCQMPNYGCEDPRWARKEDLYYPSHNRKLDIPLWAFCTDELVDCSGTVSRPVQSKFISVRGVKGNVHSVVRINSCVVKDQGSLVSESHHKTQGKDRYHSRSARPLSSTRDSKRSSSEEDSQFKTVIDQGSQGYCKSVESINISQDHLCAVHDLQLHLGDWYYLDGSGRERGPSSFSDLQSLVDQGIIKKYSSVFRKCDKLWVPVTSSTETLDVHHKSHQESSSASSEFSEHQGVSFGEPHSKSNMFNSIYPQFVGYTRGKLHELVIKSYKSREFAAVINEVLDPWINARQPKKEVEKQIYWKSEGDAHASKRIRVLVEDSEEESDFEDDSFIIENDKSTLEALSGDVTFSAEENGVTVSKEERWGLLDGRMLARVFHFLRSDLKSLVFASMTCKHWKASVKFYKEVSKNVNLSSLGHFCTDSILWNIMNAYEKDKIKSMILMGCTNITADMLEKVFLLFPGLSTVDIRGCNQFEELTPKFSNVKWIKSRNSRITKIADEPHKIRSLKQITDQSLSVSKASSFGIRDNFGELKVYFDSVDKRDTVKQLFRQNLYKRSKLYDARKSSSILSRDARTRRWSIKKSESGYKKMEEFLASRLREIMKANACDFFVPKVAEIEAKIKRGYYSGHGLSSVKEDISRMCRDAMKAKNRGDANDMNHVISLFIQLATRLEESSKYVNDRDAQLKLSGNDLPLAFCSTSSKYKKNRLVTERKYRSDGIHGGLDNGEYASDREIRRRLSKLNKKSMDSESETSDDLDRSSEDGNSDGDTSTSNTDSDQEAHLERRTRESKGNGYFTPSDGLDFITDEREWGARMTKASLVPPVTRKYDVIDQYVIVADEDDVQRKMRVSLPDDYAEKLAAQKNGTEESDMELPEVKDYKPRKRLENEVIEQEVYGIDPYTHNLLLDSMPEGLDWSLQEKHVFIEETLLRTLNMQVRHFTGTGSTPMSYPLQPVIQEIERCAEEHRDARMIGMCQGILKAIGRRPDDKYVAYRKGLGVVCNKEEGFGEDDFVVEFLGEVYPVWKWFEKQDGIRSLQKNSKDPAPEFYNIYLERPKGDADGYDLVVVDAMHKANYASRICHSCRPNCEAKVTAVGGHYQIGIYSVRKIQHGEEITFDYNSVTESKEEYEASVCLCGSQVCRGSYLNLTGEGAFQKVLKEWHGILDCHYLMLEACELNSVSEEDYNDLGRAGLGNCLLGGLPDWLVAYAARLVRFINFERTKLPEAILKHNLEEKRKYFSDICLEVERSDAEVQAEGVYNQRLQNLAVTLDKVRYVMRCVFGDPMKAPPPLEKLSPEAVVSLLWKGEDSFVEELLQCLTPHVEESTLNDLKSKTRARDPLNSKDIQKAIQKSLLWLRDEVRNLPCTYKCRHDAAADLIHIYAYTKYFFRVLDYKTTTSPPVYISPLDLGPKYADKLGAGFQEYRKIYGQNYCLGQLIFWHNQSDGEPDCTLARASKGSLSLPDISSFYAKAHKPSRQRVYGPKTVRSMLARMEKHPQRPWPKDQIWSFKNSPKFFGSPMLDAVINNTPLDREMVHWLKHRPAIFQAMWDQ
ncbi:histone-lysine N-methyltransferase ATXR3-like isoform X1 [Vicia villosa]|uniref:histone-lysine N-methyltransferase ATXR3-like isoform X1 n=1 Tax=Vicia villosa TaxID=3911 RepID=UPI00273B7578|nr:histone-lysine N-methyltransferase ATXR3-like isoform X1 [Vicia villosa]